MFRLSAGTMTSFPPYGRLLQLRTELSDDGSLLFVMPFHDDVVGRPGYLHGGAIAGLLEFAAYGELARAVEGRGVTPKPVSVTIDYLLGGKARNTFAAATIARLGARIANVEALAWQKDRKTPIASCRINFLLAQSDPAVRADSRP